MHDTKISCCRTLRLPRPARMLGGDAHGFLKAVGADFVGVRSADVGAASFLLMAII